MSKHKVSYGLALCRYNRERNNTVEIFSIKKRFTYCYFSFVHGLYDNKNIRHDSRNFAYIKYLFDNMSFQEKLTILSMNFGNMWWYIWLNNPEKCIGMFNNKPTDNKTINLNGGSGGGENNGGSGGVASDGGKDIIQSVHDYKTYFKKKNKFEKKFLHNGGSKLQEIINNSKNCDSIWEIPKGAKNLNETNLDAAIREFSEESLVNCANYNVLYHVEPIVLTYKDNGVVYRHVYFIAELNECGYTEKATLKPKLNFKSYSQLSEVADLRWISQTYISTLDMPQKNKKNMLRLYGDIVKKFKKYNSHFETNCHIKAIYK